MISNPEPREMFCHKWFRRKPKELTVEFKLDDTKTMSDAFKSWFTTLAEQGESPLNIAVYKLPNKWRARNRVLRWVYFKIKCPDRKFFNYHLDHVTKFENDDGKHTIAEWIPDKETTL